MEIHHIRILFCFLLFGLITCSENHQSKTPSTNITEGRKIATHLRTWSQAGLVDTQNKKLVDGRLRLAQAIKDDAIEMGLRAIGYTFSALAHIYDSKDPGSTFLLQNYMPGNFSGQVTGNAEKTATGFVVNSASIDGVQISDVEVSNLTDDGVQIEFEVTSAKASSSLAEINLNGKIRASFPTTVDLSTQDLYPQNISFVLQISANRFATGDENPFSFTGSLLAHSRQSTSRRSPSRIKLNGVFKELTNNGTNEFSAELTIRIRGAFKLENTAPPVGSIHSNIAQFEFIDKHTLLVQGDELQVQYRHDPANNDIQILREDIFTSTLYQGGQHKSLEDFLLNGEFNKIFILNADGYYQTNLSDTLSKSASLDGVLVHPINENQDNWRDLDIELRYQESFPELPTATLSLRVNRIGFQSAIASLAIDDPNGRIWTQLFVSNRYSPNFAKLSIYARLEDGFSRLVAYYDDNTNLVTGNVMVNGSVIGTIDMQNGAPIIRYPDGSFSSLIF